MNTHPRIEKKQKKGRWSRIFSMTPTNSYKKSGISILLVFGGTFGVLVFAFFLLTSVLSSLERSADVEQSNKIFYATESGIEAGLYAANVEGPGVHFCDCGDTVCVNNESVCSFDNVDGSQQIEHANGLTTSWAIKGRQELFEGKLYENDYVEIPVLWEESVQQNKKGIKIIFQEIPDFDFGLDNDEDAVAVDWMMTGVIDFNLLDSGEEQYWIDQGKSDGDAVSFVPYISDEYKRDPCDYDPGQKHLDAFICRDDLVDEETTIVDSKNQGHSKYGFLMPGKGESYTHEFVSKYQDVAFIFQSLLPYVNTDGDKIESIPFEVEYSYNGTGVESIPTPDYTIFSKVTGRGFTQESQVTLPHKRDSGILNYVIFD